jgi:hypothetical protein
MLEAVPRLAGGSAGVVLAFSVIALIPLAAGAALQMRARLPDA